MFRGLKPLISVITVVRNGRSTIRDCLASVARQTFPAEHLVIDGLSTDGTVEVLSEVAGPRQWAVDGGRWTVKEQTRDEHQTFNIEHPTSNTKPRTKNQEPATRGQEPGTKNQEPGTDSAPPIFRWLSEPDGGIYDAMNKGIALAKGDVIGFLHANDFYAGPRLLDRVAAVFEDPAVACAYGDLVFVRTALSAMDGREQPLQQRNGEFFLPEERVVRRWKAGELSARSFHWGWMPPHPTFFVRRSVYERLGAFRFDLGTAADYELMLRFLLKHRLAARYIPEVMVKMRVGGVSTASLRNRLAANRNDRKAWEVNGLRPYPWTL